MTSTTSTENNDVRDNQKQEALPRTPPSRRKLLAGFIIGAIVVTAWAKLGIADGPGDAKELVQTTANRALDIIKDEVTPAAEKRDQLEALFDETADFYTVSRLVLARNWTKLNKDEQLEFQRVFRRHLSITYGRNVDNFPDIAFVVSGEREEARGDRTVNTKIIRPNAADILIDYRMRVRGSEWKIIDIVIEGVSMVSNFRSQFQDVASKRGPKGLIALLRDKNAESEAAEDAPGLARKSPAAADAS